MTPGVCPLVVGNWKMNGLRASLEEIRIIINAMLEFSERSDVGICLPATLVYLASQLCKDSSLLIGAQDCHMMAFGAYTGDISANMLADCGASFVIIGHSERRIYHQETDDMICAKVKAACVVGLKPIICVGETVDECRSGRTLEVLQQQLEVGFSLLDVGESANVIIAYEPVSAIGTGLVPSIADLKVVHTFIRNFLVCRFSDEGQKMRILYGGSVNADNASQFLLVDNLDGLLIGGASLQANSFLAIVQNCNNLSSNFSFFR